MKWFSFKKKQKSLDMFVFYGLMEKGYPFSKLNIKINLGGKAKWTKENHFKHWNRKNGITLIALVISIIVMLILAGVSLNAVIGDNGIITQAQNATYMQSVAVLEEYLNTYYV